MQFLYGLIREPAIAVRIDLIEKVFNKKMTIKYKNTAYHQSLDQNMHNMLVAEVHRCVGVFLGGGSHQNTQGIFHFCFQSISDSDIHRNTKIKKESEK